MLDFSNRTFNEFIVDSVQKDIGADKYAYASGSKANRLRASGIQSQTTLWAS